MEHKSFDTLYSEILPVLEDLDSRRKKLMRKILKFAGISSGLGLLIGFGVFVFGGVGLLLGGVFGVASVVGLIGGLIGFFVSRKEVKSLKSTFKIEVIGEMIQMLGSGLNYNSAASIAPSTYEASKLFTRSYDDYKGDDYVSGTIGETDLEFSELHTQYYTRDKDGNKNWHTIFRGLFFVADFHKDFHGETFVLPDTAESLLGSFGKRLQKWNKSKGDLVSLENVEFEKAFVVYGSDQIEARYILSPKMMEMMLELKQKMNAKMHLSFVNSKLYLAVSLNKNLFEFPFFKSLLDRSFLEEYFTYMDSFIGIVEDLDLNTRIWTKE